MDLEAPVKFLKGIGPKTAEILNKAGIKTVRDFFYTLPKDYENFIAPTKIADITPGKVTVRGKIDSISSHRARTRRLTITEGIIRDETAPVRAVWFNQAYRAKQFDPNKEYYFTGNFELKYGRYQLSSPSAALADDIEHGGGFQPIYVAHGRIKTYNFKSLIEKSRDRFAEIPDLLPTVAPGVRRDSLFKIHFPSSEKDIKIARDYLAYEELFALILAAKLNKQENQKLTATSIPFSAEKIKKLVEKLPFKLTNAQRLAAWEIFQDMSKNTPMNRLLQGDVGSGKTVVAALAAYAAAKDGLQTALLAPTAILANQHYESLKNLLEPFGLKIALLTGATKQKSTLKKAIREGEIDIVVGTHALLTDDTEFKDLSLVIIDEQHRFGVGQREKIVLKSPKNRAPHLLSMTATPIPRSLQLTIFGDLDVSILNELPKGRQPIETKIIREVEQKSDLYPKMREIMSQKQQIYWICKTIEDNTEEDALAVSRGRSLSPVVTGRASLNPLPVGRGHPLETANTSSSLSSVKSRTKKLKELFPEAKIEFLHGKMKAAEKDEIMSKFASGEIQILVSTTVVEVGVDVPNSTLIIIEDAENYGLAQLHQLRGRVGRGQEKSFCYLLTTGENAPSRRLKELEKSTDGFYLSEVDLKLRGPGEIYGSLQHGALDLRIATLSDTKLIKKARDDTDIFLQNPENMLKYKELMSNISRYQQLTTLN